MECYLQKNVLFMCDWTHAESLTVCFDSGDINVVSRTIFSVAPFSVEPIELFPSISILLKEKNVQTNTNA